MKNGKSKSKNERIGKLREQYKDFDKDFEALGGSKEDFDLIADVDDDNDGSEVEVGSSKPDAKLLGDVSNFLSELGLEGSEPKRQDQTKADKESAKTEAEGGKKEKQSKKAAKEDKSKGSEAKKEKSSVNNNDKAKDTDTKQEKAKSDKSDWKKEENKRKKLLENNKKQQENSKKTEFKAESKAKAAAVKPQGKKIIFEPSEIKQSIELTHPGKLVLEPRNDWFELEDKLPQEGDIYDDPEFIYEKAKSLLTTENELYTHEVNNSTSQKQFMSQLLSAGTLSDKISALTLLIQESPLHSVKYFESLMKLCEKKSRGSAMQAVTALKDIFIGGVLPERKLKWFKGQPVNKNTPISWLIVWAFEDWLKQYYFNLLQLMEGLNHDPVVFIRTNSVTCVFDLLKGKPEQEVNLLRLGVNKLGDSARNVASKVSNLILRLEEAHPAMKPIVTNAISELIFRQGVDYHAKYFAVITLNQTILSARETELSNTLVKLYLTLFERILTEKQGDLDEKQVEAKPKKARHKDKVKRGKKGGVRQAVKKPESIPEEETAKLLSAILTGLNRAYPFADLPKDVFEKHVDTLYQVTHSANFGTSVQALMLIFQVTKKQKSLTDRYYRTLYESLFDPRLATSSKLRLYLNLVFRSLRDDGNKERVLAFGKRLAQIADHLYNIGMVSAVIFLINELSKTYKGMSNLVAQSVETESPYDGKARDPRYSHANNARMWELIPLLRHFHPTVSVYAEELFAKGGAMARPDLGLHTLTHFLDRFVYKNPKQKQSTKGGSIMQPLAGQDHASSLFNVPSAHGVPVTNMDWKKVDLTNVDASERFFHQYFANRQDSGNAKKLKAGAVAGNLDDAEDQVWNAIVQSNPAVEAGNDGGFSDEDLSFSDMEGLDEDDEDILGEDDQVDLEDDGSDELPSDLSDSEGEQDKDEDASALDESDDEALERGNLSKKRAHEAEGNTKKAKRRMLKDLPTFASAEDYAQYLNSDSD